MPSFATIRNILLAAGLVALPSVARGAEGVDKHAADAKPEEEEITTERSRPGILDITKGDNQFSYSLRKQKYGLDLSLVPAGLNLSFCCSPLSWLSAAADLDLTHGRNPGYHKTPVEDPPDDPAITGACELRATWKTRINTGFGCRYITAPAIGESGARMDKGVFITDLVCSFAYKRCVYSLSLENLFDISAAGDGGAESQRPGIIEEPPSEAPYFPRSFKLTFSYSF